MNFNWKRLKLLPIIFFLMNGKNSIMVKVRAVASLSDIFGNEVCELVISRRATLKDVFDRISSDNSRFSKIVFSEKGTVNPTIMVLLNGKEVSSFDPEKIKIKEGEEIVFIPLIHGG